PNHSSTTGVHQNKTSRTSPMSNSSPLPTSLSTSAWSTLTRQRVWRARIRSSLRVRRMHPSFTYWSRRSIWVGGLSYWASNQLSSSLWIFLALTDAARLKPPRLLLSSTLRTLIVLRSCFALSSSIRRRSSSSYTPSSMTNPCVPHTCSGALWRPRASHPKSARPSLRLSTATSSSPVVATRREAVSATSDANERLIERLR